EQRHLRPDAELLARMDDRAHAVVIERLLQADLRLDPAYARHVARRRILHDEEVAGLVRGRMSLHRFPRSLDARGEGLAVRLERGETGPRLLRKRDECIDIAA